jgi:hypothetical protein
VKIPAGVDDLALDRDLFEKVVRAVAVEPGSLDLGAAHIRIGAAFGDVAGRRIIDQTVVADRQPGRVRRIGERGSGDADRGGGDRCGEQITHPSSPP